MKTIDIEEKLETYHKRRTQVRTAFLGLIVPVFIVGFVTHGEVATGMAGVIGFILILLILLLFALGSVWNRCPGCGESFGKRLKGFDGVEHYDYDEGLPLFNDLRECPFCRLKLTCGLAENE